DAIALGDEGAEESLFRLLSGHAAPSTHREPSHVASSARAFAHFLPAATPERKIEIDIISFGGSGHVGSNDDLGTYAIGSALYENALEACGFCEDPKTSIHTHRS